MMVMSSFLRPVLFMSLPTPKARPASGTVPKNIGTLQGSEISTPYSSVTSLSEDTLQYLETHQHLLPGAKRPASASRSRVASLRHSVSPSSARTILESPRRAVHSCAEYDRLLLS